MPSFTLGRAAKLYGLHRSTLYAAINRGALSVTLNGKGQKVVDLSEMLRVFGEPQSTAAQQFDTSTVAPTPSQTVDSTPSSVLALETLAPLLEELRLLREEQQASREANRLLREEVRELRETLLRIEHKPDTTLAPGPDRLIDRLCRTVGEWLLHR